MRFIPFGGYGYVPARDGAWTGGCRARGFRADRRLAAARPTTIRSALPNAACAAPPCDPLLGWSHAGRSSTARADIVALPPVVGYPGMCAGAAGTRRPRCTCDRDSGQRRGVRRRAGRDRVRPPTSTFDYGLVAFSAHARFKIATDTRSAHAPRWTAVPRLPAGLRVTNPQAVALPRAQAHGREHRSRG